MLGACAKRADKIAPQYVSPLEYRDYDCDQISGEIRRVSRRASEVAGVQDRKAKNDSVAMGVGLIIFWPSLFFLGGGDQKEQLSRLKGEYDALEQIAIQKKCAIAEQIQDEREAAIQTQEESTTHRTQNP